MSAALTLLLLLAAAPPDSGTAYEVRDTLGAGRDPRVRLREPSGVACDAFGRITVADATLRVVQRWDADGRWLDEAGTLGSDADEFRHPATVVRLGAGGMAVLDTENRRIVQFDLHGRDRGVLVDLADAALESQTGRITPVALAADDGGAMFVADRDRDRLLVFDFQGRYLRELGGYGPRPGSFQRLAAVACGPHGELVTCERPLRATRRDEAPRARLQWLDPGGQPLQEQMLVLAVPRAAAGEFALAVDDSGRVAVADEAGGEVRILGPDGAPVARLAGLARPTAVAFAADGTLCVAEAGAARVRRFRRAATER